MDVGTVSNVIQHESNYRSNLDLSAKYASIKIPEVQFGFTPIFEIGQMDNAKPLTNFCKDLEKFEDQPAVAQFGLYK